MRVAVEIVSGKHNYFDLVNNGDSFDVYKDLDLFGTIRRNEKGEWYQSHGRELPPHVVDQLVVEILRTLL